MKSIAQNDNLVLNKVINVANNEEIWTSNAFVY